jgi:diguanylate cyclase (GGDEF)-like protein/PAS domain S-box-containing protein
LPPQEWSIATFPTEDERKESLLISGALQKAILRSANFSSIATDEKGVIQIFNAGAEHMLGYAAADVINKVTPADLSDPEELLLRAKALSEEAQTAIAPGFEALIFKASQGIEDVYELTYIRNDGIRLAAIVSVTALRNDQDSIIGYLLMGTDNTARKKLEEEQKILGQRLLNLQFYTRSLFEANVDALLTADSVGIITDVNDQMETLTGCIRDELIGSLFKNYFSDELSAENAIQLTISKGKVKNYELAARDAKGRETPVSFNATTLYDHNRQLQGVLATVRDITERKIAEKQILDLALYDSLTSLPNRRLLADRLSQIMSASKRSGRFYAVMFLDLDNFKALNDLHGHFMGDMLLVEVARRLGVCVRQMDVVARFGGDEFVVVLSEIGANRKEALTQAHSIAEKLRTSLEQPYVLDVQQRVTAEKVVEHCCTASIGVVVFADNQCTQDEVLKRADSAMYQAKELGGNRIEICAELTKMLPAPLPAN